MSGLGKVNEKSTLTKYLRVVELLGIAIAFLAWGVNWSYVKKWETSIDSFGKIIMLYQMEYAENHTSSLIEFESAVSRASKENDIVSEDLFNNYTTACEFSVVRLKFSSLISHKVNYLEKIVRLIDDYTINFHLKKPFSLSIIDEEIKKIRKTFIDKSDQNFSNTDHFPVPDFSEMSIKEAFALEDRISKFDALVTPCGVELIEIMQRKINLGNIIFIIFFSAGTFITMLAKLIEYKYDNQRDAATH